jgi:hypothetical protein
MAITKFDQFDFLIDIVPRDELKPPKRQVSWGRHGCAADCRALAQCCQIHSSLSAQGIYCSILTSPSLFHLWILLTQCLWGVISVKRDKMKIKDSSILRKSYQEFLTWYGRTFSVSCRYQILKNSFFVYKIAFGVSGLCFLLLCMWLSLVPWLHIRTLGFKKDQCLGSIFPVSPIRICDAGAQASVLFKVPKYTLKVCNQIWELPLKVFPWQSQETMCLPAPLFCLLLARGHTNCFFSTWEHIANS